jgi:hypothetical protein
MSENELNIAATKNTPKVIGSMTKGFLRLEGSSFPENSKKFYDPLMIWVAESRKIASTFEIEASFSYVSSSSLIAILNLLKRFQSLYGAESVTLKWYYEEDDDDILKIAEDYRKIIEIAIECISIQG